MKMSGVLCTGLIWLRTGTSGVFLWTRQRTFGFNKMLGNSWVGELLVASQGVSSMVLINTKYSPYHNFSLRIFVCPFPARLNLTNRSTIRNSTISLHCGVTLLETGWADAVLYPVADEVHTAIYRCETLYRTHFGTQWRYPVCKLPSRHIQQCTGFR
jgi:hypothetical protein